MNCIDQIILQRYIDNECSANEKAAIEEHLKECSSCREKFEEQLHQCLFIKQVISELTDEHVLIPTFEIPQRQKKLKIRSEIIYAISAACIILFMLIVDKNQNTNHCKSIFSNTYEFDSNQPITKQAFVINYVDAEGNQSEFYIQ